MIKFILLLETEFKQLRTRKNKARLMDLGIETPSEWQI